MIGRPRAHFRALGSTNDRARELAQAGAPHGTVVTAGEQTAGRGRQGRSWAGPPGRALLLSVVLRDFDALLPLRAGLAVADVAGPSARVKWPNDVWLDGRKVAGILVEGRPQEGWAVAGIGVNAAVEPAELPPDVRAIAGTLGRPAAELDDVLAELLAALDGRLAQPAEAVVAALRERDALRGRPVRWAGGEGEGAGIDDGGRLLVRRASGDVAALESGEVHLGSAAVMDAITVRRHGTRWAVFTDPDTAPTAEYDTRELAEIAARQEAAGREVVVEDEGDTALGGGGGAGDRTDRDEPRIPGSPDADPPLRTTQGGL